MEPIRLGVIGVGGMGETHVRHFSAIEGCNVVALCDVNQDRARAIAEKYGVPSVFKDVTEVLDKADVDAIAVVVPDPFHAPVSLEAIARGKHVLCEKPLATNYPDAARMRDAAEAAGLVNMVNLSYRECPALHEAHRVVKSGLLGGILHVEASYLQSWLNSKKWADWRNDPAWLWRLSSAHGSKGVLGDIGVHILDFLSYGAAEDIVSVNCRLRTFQNIKGAEHAGYTLDANDSAVITVELDGGALGTVHTTRWANGHENDLYLRIFGASGGLEIRWKENPCELRLCTGDDVHTNTWKAIQVDPVPSIYARFIAAIQTGSPAGPTFRDGAKIQRVLDACFESDATGKTIDCRTPSVV